jgi:hypothetical protein
MMQIKIKKFIIVVMIIIIVLFIFVILFNLRVSKTEYNNLSPFKTVNKETTLYLSTDYNTYSEDIKSIDIYIHNETGAEIVYGTEYNFEVFKHNKWYMVPYANKKGSYSFTDIGIILESNTVKKEVLNLELYKVREGHYRYVKEIQKIVTTVEFYIK